MITAKVSGEPSFSTDSVICITVGDSFPSLKNYFNKYRWSHFNRVFVCLRKKAKERDPLKAKK